MFCFQNVLKRIYIVKADCIFIYGINTLYPPICHGSLNYSSAKSLFLNSFAALFSMLFSFIVFCLYYIILMCMLGKSLELRLISVCPIAGNSLTLPWQLLFWENLPAVACCCTAGFVLDEYAEVRAFAVH